MCYAHWEGHAKFCGDRFLEYLTMRSLKFSEITPSFYEVRFLREIASASSMSYIQRVELIQKIRSSIDERFSRFPKELIDTRSNLNSAVLQDLCLICGISYEDFVNDADFIDRILLKRRNEVAHGEAVFIDAVDSTELVDRTLRIMRNFRDKLEQVISLQSYRLAA